MEKSNIKQQKYKKILGSIILLLVIVFCSTLHYSCSAEMGLQGTVSTQETPEIISSHFTSPSERSKKESDKNDLEETSKSLTLGIHNLFESGESKIDQLLDISLNPLLLPLIKKKEKLSIEETTELLTLETLRVHLLSLREIIKTSQANFQENETELDLACQEIRLPLLEIDKLLSLESFDIPTASKADELRTFVTQTFNPLLIKTIEESVLIPLKNSLVSLIVLNFGKNRFIGNTTRLKCLNTTILNLENIIQALRTQNLTVQKELENLEKLSRVEVIKKRDVILEENKLNINTSYNINIIKEKLRNKESKSDKNLRLALEAIGKLPESQKNSSGLDLDELIQSVTKSNYEPEEDKALRLALEAIGKLPESQKNSSALDLDELIQSVTKSNSEPEEDKALRLALEAIGKLPESQKNSSGLELNELIEDISRSSFKNVKTEASKKIAPTKQKGLKKQPKNSLEHISLIKSKKHETAQEKATKQSIELRTPKSNFQPKGMTKEEKLAKVSAKIENLKSQYDNCPKGASGDSQRNVISGRIYAAELEEQTLKGTNNPIHRYTGKLPVAKKIKPKPEISSAKALSELQSIKTKIDKKTDVKTSSEATRKGNLYLLEQQKQTKTKELITKLKLDETEAIEKAIKTAKIEALKVDAQKIERQLLAITESIYTNSERLKSTSFNVSENAKQNIRQANKKSQSEYMTLITEKNKLIQTISEKERTLREEIDFITQKFKALYQKYKVD